MHRTPLWYVLRSRSRGYEVSQTPIVYRYELAHHKPRHFSNSFTKRYPSKARSDRASRNLWCSAWRVTGGGSVGSLPGLVSGGVGSSAGCRIAYIACDPQLPPFPTQNGPTGFQRRPRCAALLITRRQTLARTSMGPADAYSPRGRGLLPVYGFHAHFARARCTIREPHSHTVNTLPALRPRCHYGGHSFCKEFAGFQGAYP